MLSNYKLTAFIPTIQPEKAKYFYQDILELKLLSEDKFALEFDANGTHLRVTTVQNFTPYPFTVLGWKVSGIENVIGELNKKGIVFKIFGFFEQDTSGIWKAPDGTKVAWFEDADGNLLSVSESLPSEQPD
jgi:catechol 2,3-dioxygenase-like lactoylglutathione lyase family enzyme